MTTKTTGLTNTTDTTPDQPISFVEWISRDNLEPNDYNPNHVAPPELDLLRFSIMTDGWTKPIVVVPPTKKKGKYTIVDGFHRWKLSSERDIAEMTNGLVPIVVLHHCKTRTEQMMGTIRHNRASGVHSTLKMAEIVRSLIESGVSQDAIAIGAGMDEEEIARLANRAGMPNHPEATAYNKSWKPKF